MIAAMKKRLRRNKQQKIEGKGLQSQSKRSKSLAGDDYEVVANRSGLKSRIDCIEEEMHKREHFAYLNRKYIETVGSNQVLVMQTPEVKSLDMIPRVNIIEDLQFRKALPKAYKHFESALPFS